MEQKILEIARRFALPQGELRIEPYGNGHINDTYRVTVDGASGEAGRFILQRVNQYVFKRPQEVIENIERVTAYLRDILRDAGGNPARETLTLVRTADGAASTLDDAGELWRMYLFIEDTISRDLPDTPALFELSGEAFGRFQRQMEGFPVASLHETIPDFHNTPERYRQLEDAIARDEVGRLGGVAKEVAFCRAREADTHVLTDALRTGQIPLRVTHNDTKLNNVLLDAKTGKGVCVIDLDTVMPGLAAYDFGDSIRFGANTAEEDERDLSKVRLSLEMFEAFTRGYLRGAGGALTQREVELLPWGAKLMTLECGMRFLADYLNGDKYFKVHREGHNLDRARTQFALVECMERSWEEMGEIVRRA